MEEMFSSLADINKKNQGIEDKPSKIRELEARIKNLEEIIELILAYLPVTIELKGNIIQGVKK